MEGRFVIVTKEEKERMIQEYRELLKNTEILRRKLDNSYTEEEILAYTE